MCTLVKKQDNLLLTATEDIKCYKTLTVGQDGTLKSYYQHFKYELSKQYHTHIHKSVDMVQFKPTGNVGDVRNIKEGFHSFKEFEDVMYEYSDPFSDWVHTVIVECIIPKDSHYYKGYNNCKLPSLCSSLEEFEQSFHQEVFVSTDIIVNRIIPREEMPFSYKIGDEYILLDKDKANYDIGRMCFLKYDGKNFLLCDVWDDIKIIETDAQGKPIDNDIIIIKKK